MRHHFKQLLRAVTWYSALVGALLCGFASALHAANQTDSVTPVVSGSRLPYRVELREYDFGSATLPSLQSYAAAEYNGKWVLMSGRTNGLHGFETSAAANFPVAFQNRDVWVIDPVTKQTWSRSLSNLASSGLTSAQMASLTPTNNQFTQLGNRLYLTGGYGATTPTGGFDTFSTLSAIDLPGLVDWVVNGTGTAAQHLRQLTGETFAITGGAMYEIDGRFHQVFGHDFAGGYTPGRNGTYAQNVRSFNIVDDGVTLSIANLTTTPVNPDYRRRDLNVFPVLKPDGSGGADVELVALSGVFTLTDGAWTVPVEIDSSGQPTMADPNAPGTFKQAMNNYHSAKVGLYSPSKGVMHELLLGGITLQYYNAATNTFVTDNAFPFTNDITAVTIDASGQYQQSLVGEFPVILDNTNMRLRFGANAEFFPAPGITELHEGILNLDSITTPTTIGYVFGGLFANAPHVRGVPGAVSGASGLMFEVLVTPVSNLAGDYNQNGMVDAADYTVWRDSVGAIGNLLAADGNGDFVVNSADELIWRNNFGAIAAAGSAVPEPSAGALLVGLVLLQIIRAPLACRQWEVIQTSP